MKLFKGDAVSKVNKLLDGAEKQKEKYSKKLEGLKQDYELIYQGEQDDFNMAILEDREPNKKLAADRKKVAEEIKDAEVRLSQIDVVVQNELANAKSDIEREIREFVQAEGEKFNKLFAEMNELKLAYLQKLVDYSQMKQQYNVKYWRTFRDIEDLVGLRNRDPRSDFELSQGQFQRAEAYTPMMTPDELSVALMDGELLHATEVNRNAFK